MSISVLILLILGFAIVGFVLGRRKAVFLAAQSDQKIHSLPKYHGQFVALFAAAPALILMALWLFIQPTVIDGRAAAQLEAQKITEQRNYSLVMLDVRRVSAGLDVLIKQGEMDEETLENLNADLTDVRASLAGVGVALGAEVDNQILSAAKSHRSETKIGHNAMTAIALLMSLALAGLSYRKISLRARARQTSETFIMCVLIACSSVAILTTVGIVLSMVFEAFNFFKLYSAKEFFTSTTWNPQFRGGSTLGIIPLLWGTLYVSLVALLVAVPIGLMIAIYLAEYATPRVRGFAKPAIEILAGIPTIVYGLFALITVGPLLRDFFEYVTGSNGSASSVMTAGLVMGIMLIPFVSSLSDDVINAVPQSLRDGSYALGATQSETIKRVIFPAALPGVVGAILLAASRAIGETMIVVLGAGAAAKLSLNPFEAMTTVTVKIVSQLTGDTEFASPETLVAFALGLTLFAFTLLLNVIALYIVRKYREQYD